MKNSKEMATGKWELWRRLFLLFCCGLAAWFYMYVSTSPLLRIQDEDLAGRQERETAGHFVTSRQRRLSTLSLEDYAKAIAGNNFLVVEGEEWDSFLQKWLDAEGEEYPEKWRKNIEKEPLKTVLNQAENPLAPIYLKYVDSAGETHYFQLMLLTFAYDDFSIGGLSGSHRVPPDSLLYPARPLAYIFILIGLLMYVKLPKPRHKRDSLVYSSWKNTLIDFLSVFLFTMFFFLPFMIVGGSVQSIMIMAPLVIAFWGMALISSLLMYIAAWNASFSMEVDGESLKVSSYRGGYKLLYKDIESYQPAEKRYPKWFKFLMFLAMLSSSGSMKPVMAAQWLNAGGVQSQGLRLCMKNGEKVDFWLVDQMGNQVFSGVETLLNSLSASKIPWKEDLAMDQSLTHSPGGSGFWEKKPVLIPYFVFSFIFLFVMLSSILISESQITAGIPEVSRVRTMETAIQYPHFAGVPLSTTKPEWVRYFGGDGVDRGVAIRRVPDKGFAISGVSNSDNITRPAQYMIMTDYEGNLMWENRYSSPGKECFNEGMIWTQEGDFLLTGTEGNYLGRNAFLTKISATGEKIWHREYEMKENSTGVDLWQHTEGDILMLLNSGSHDALLRVDSQGNKIWEKPLGEPTESRSASSMEVLEDEKILVAGSLVEKESDDWRASLTMLDSNGNLLWQREYGEEGDQKIFASTLLEDGTMAFTGMTYVGSALYRSAFLLITDLEGSILLEKSYSFPESHGAGIGITEVGNGNIAILVNANSDSTNHDFSLVSVVNRQGEILVANRLEAGGEVRGSDIILTPDQRLLITGMAGGQDGFGINSTFLLKTSY